MMTRKLFDVAVRDFILKLEKENTQDLKTMR